MRGLLCHGKLILQARPELGVNKMSAIGCLTFLRKRSMIVLLSRKISTFGCKSTTRWYSQSRWECSLFDVRWGCRAQVARQNGHIAESFQRYVTSTL